MIDIQLLHLLLQPHHQSSPIISAVAQPFINPLATLQPAAQHPYASTPPHHHHHQHQHHHQSPPSLRIGTPSSMMMPSSFSPSTPTKRGREEEVGIPQAAFGTPKVSKSLHTYLPYLPTNGCILTFIPALYVSATTTARSVCSLSPGYTSIITYAD